MGRKMDKLGSDMEQIMAVLRPPPSVFEAQALAHASSSEVDASTILSAILKARDVGIAVSTLGPAIERLREERAAELQAHVSAHGAAKHAAPSAPRPSPLVKAARSWEDDDRVSRRVRAISTEL